MILRWTSFRRYAPKWAFPAKEIGRPELGVSRRGIIASLVAAFLAAPRSARAAYPARLRGTSGGGGGGGVPLVGPHAGWISSGGTTGSGSAIPTQQALSTAKASCGWIWGATFDRFASDYWLGVCADALGGIANVTFSGDIATTVVTNLSVQTFPHPNGLGGTISILGYWIKLNRAAFTAVTDANGKLINVYATANPTDTNLQPRTIGGNGFGGGSLGSEATNWTDAERHPMQLYARSTQYDSWDKTVKTSGGDFTTLQAALVAWKTAGKMAGRVTVFGTSTQTLTDNSSSTKVDSEGYLEICANPGDVVTIQYYSSFDPYALSNHWDLWPGTGLIKFVGDGIRIDKKNFRGIISVLEFTPFWFYGCRIFNSVGDRAAQLPYWNGGPAYDFKTSFSTSGRGCKAYFDGCDIDDVQAGEYCYRVIWTTFDGLFVGRGMSTRVFAYNTVRDTGVDPAYPEVLPGMTVTYNGPSTNVKAVYVASDANPSGDILSLALMVNDVEFAKVQWPNCAGGYRVKQDAAGPYIDQQVSSLVAWINGLATTGGHDFSAVQNNTDADMWSSFLNSALSETKVFSFAGSTGTCVFKTGVSAHTEWWQHFDTANMALELQYNDNYYCCSNKWLLCSWTSTFLNCSNQGTIIFKNNVLTRSVQSGTYAVYAGRMVLFENNYLDDGLFDNALNRSGQWSRLAHNVLGAPMSKVKRGTGLNTWPDYPAKVNNIYVQDVDGAPSGAHDGPNYDAGSNAGWKACAADFTGEDFRAASLTLSHVVTPINAYDMNNNPRAASDVFGPIRLAG